MRTLIAKKRNETGYLKITEGSMYDVCIQRPKACTGKEGRVYKMYEVKGC